MIPGRLQLPTENIQTRMSPGGWSERLVSNLILHKPSGRRGGYQPLTNAGRMQADFMPRSTIPGKSPDCYRLGIESRGNPGQE